MTGPTSSRLRALATITLAACVAVGCDSAATDGSADPPSSVRLSAEADQVFRGEQPVTPYEMPDITLEATDDRPFNLVHDTAYPTTLVFFGYTSCREVCPLVMSDLTAAYLRLADDVRDQTQVVFVTTDPARDTTRVLRDYLAKFDPSYVGLTGDLADIVAAGKAMGVAIEGRERLPSGGYDVGHGAQVVGFRDNEAPVIWTEGTPVDDLVADITTLAGS
jgi:protein SCO1/2